MDPSFEPSLPWRRCEERSDEAIHPSFATPWIASRSLSSGAHSRDPLAHNDDKHDFVISRRGAPGVLLETLAR
jgi:hypothetical protein